MAGTLDCFGANFMSEDTPLTDDAPLTIATASVGTSTTAARADHQHGTTGKITHAPVASSQTLDGAVTGIWLDQAAQTVTDTGGSRTLSTVCFDTFNRPTINRQTNAITVTDAASLYISNAPAAGTGVTISNAWSLWCDNGTARFDGGWQALSPSAMLSYSVGEAFAAGSRMLYSDNPTAATSGTQQNSPILALRGRGWKTATTATSQQVEFGLQTQPVLGVTAARGRLAVGVDINASGTYTSVFSVGSNGQVSSLVGSSSRAPSATGQWSNQSAATLTDDTTAQSGTAASNHFNTWAQPTLAASNTLVTTTDSATMYIAGAPAAGTNQTITKAWALLVGGGNVGLNGDKILAGGGNGLTIENTSSSGQTYVTNCTAGDDADRFYINSGTAATAGNLFKIANNGNSCFSVNFWGQTSVAPPATTSEAYSLGFVYTQAANAYVTNSNITNARFNFAAATQTWPGDTATTVDGYAGLTLTPPSLDAALAGLTLGESATLRVTGAPSANSGNITITNAYGIHANGLCRFEGDGTHVWEVPSNTTGIGNLYGIIPVKMTGVGTVYIPVYLPQA